MSSQAVMASTAAALAAAAPGCRARAVHGIADRRFAAISVGGLIAAIATTAAGAPP
jgi:hypothetical protein